MKKILLFDFWGTLAENGVWSPTKQIRNILGIRLPFSEYVNRMQGAMMTKKHEDLEAAFRSVCSEFALDCDDAKIEELIGMWNKNWMLAKPYEEVADELAKLKEKGFTLVLVANTDQFSIQNVLEKFSLTGLFDKLYFSCDVGLIKNDEAFFPGLCSELGVGVGDCVMIGDSIQSDVIAAKAVGLSAVLVDRKNTRDYHPKIQSLKELEAVLESL